MARKAHHEVRDPLHVFVCLDSDERRVVDAPAIQRLRHIHQLALTYLVYPGATHRRFEHSLGVMELASRVYDIVLKDENLVDKVRDIRPQNFQAEYWRRVIRMAALCHDIGHLPFSHAAEKELLPERTTHEHLTLEFIRSKEMNTLWDALKLQVEDVAKVAVGPGVYSEPLSPWETILSEIIVGDAFGVDRMDYLLRDSLHAGVAYGRFDHFRLIDCIRILPKIGGADEPTLGISHGGLHSAEAMLLARYFMYMQLYFHPVRRVYDIHLKDFLKEWLPGGSFSANIHDHLKITDNEVWAALLEAARDERQKGSLHAKRIVERKHFKVIYSRNPADIKLHPDAAQAVYRHACEEFGGASVRYDSYKQKQQSVDFPILMGDGRIVSAFELSDTLQKLPVAALDFVFIDPTIREKAENWLRKTRTEILRGGNP